MGIIVVNGVTKTVSANAGEVYYEGSSAYIVMPDNAGFASSPATQPTAPASTTVTTANVVSNSAPGFDPDFYKAQNPDVAAAGVDPLNHFRTVGWREGRDPNPYFDTKGYLATYGDVAAAGVNPLDHYNANGWREGRDPSAWFDTSSYLDANPDVRAAGVNPLQHFLANGQFEGRAAIPQVVNDTNGTPNLVPVGAPNGTPVGLTVSWGGWQTTTFSISNDTSGGGFAINPTTGVVTVADASKLTPGGNYSITVTSLDDGHSISTIFSLPVAGTTVQVPIITSDGGGTTASKSVAENTTAVTTVVATDGDGPTPTYSLFGGADQSKFSINASTGELSFLTAPNFEAPTDSDTNNTYIVTVRASSGGDNDDQTITVTVTNVNGAPVITSGTSGSIAEGSSAATVVYDTNAIDDGENSNTLTYSFGGGADDGMFSINSSTGEVRFLASPNFEAPADAGDNNVYNIIVRASDGTLTTDRAVAITVTNVNETPVAADASFSGTEDIAYNGAVPAATDGDGNALTYAAVGGSAVGGSVTVNPNGTFTFTPTANFNGSATFQYVANDGTVNSAPKTVTINFGAVNDAPVADADGPYAIGEDGTLTVNAASGVLAGDVNVDTVGLTATLLSGPAHATSFALNTDGSFSYTPAANFSGADTFVYRAFDGTAFSDPVVVTINVTAANDIPVAANASFSGTEDIVYNGAVPSATDAEGSPLTYAVVAGSAVGGSVIVNTNGTFTFTPTANFNGNATFQYVANDGAANSLPKTVTINFGAVNDAPVADADGPYAIGEDGTLTVNAASGVLAGDVDVELSGLTASLLSGPAHATSFSLNTDGSFTYTPAANFTGADSFVYRAFDGTDFSAPIVVTINVTGANDAPVATDATFSGTEDVAYNGAVPAATDADGNPLTYAVVAGSATNGSVIVNTNGTFTFTPTGSFNGSATFQYVANDGTVDSAPQTVTINFGAVNDAPLATDGILSANEDGGPVMIDVASLISDIETADAGLAVTASVPASQGTVSVLGTVITFTPAANFNGAATISYTVSDGTLSDSATIAVTVAAEDDAPAAVTQSVTGIEDQVLEGTVTATDIDGGPATFSGSGTTANGGNYTVSANGSYTYTPALNFTGTDSFTFQVSNGSDPATIGTVNITIGAINDAPEVAIPIADTSVAEETALSYTLPAGTFADVDSPSLTLTATLADGGLLPSWLNFDGPSRTFTSSPGFPDDAQVGSIVVRVTASDGSLSISDTFTITVTPVNDAPVAQNNNFNIIEDTPTLINVLANDSDVDSGVPPFIHQVDGHGFTIGVAFAALDGRGMITVNGAANQTITYTPNLNYSGPASFTYTARDSAGAISATAATVNLNITAVNDAPVANADIGTAPTSLAGFSTNEDTPVILNVLANDTDIENGTPPTIGRINGALVSIGSVIAVNGGSVTVNSDWTLTFTPTLNSTQDGSFTYTAKDSSGAESGQATVVVDVITVNDPPVVDLNGATAGVDRADLPAYTSGTAAISVATAIATVTDTETAISKITLTLTADAGTPDGSPEGLTLPAGVATTLGLIGFTVTGEGTNTIEVISNTAGGISPAVFENILKTVLYHNNDQTFGFNAEDRTITVTATDGSGLASAPALVHIDLAANVTDVNGGSAVNSFLGANLADTIRGNDGNDTMEGRGGNDDIYGGTESGDSGLDTAKFTGDRADYTVTRTAPGVYTVADSVLSRDGTDTVHDVETAHFNGDNFDLALDAAIQVFDSTGNVLLASFQANQLSQAVNFANGHAGADIIELRSSASPFTSGAWPATVTEAVTIKAVGGTATINAGANSGLAIAASAVLGATDTVRLEGLNITGSGTDNVGVVFSGVYEGPSDGAIQIVNTSVSGFGQNGVAIIGGGPGLSVTIDGDNPATGPTETSTFTGSGGSTTSGGSGDILFFEFTGAAALKNIVVTGTTGTLAGAADNGIQVAGYDLGDHSVDHAIGAVTFENVAVNGTYEKTLVYVQGYNNLSALGFTGTGLNLGGAGSAATWTALFIDGGPQGGGYIPNGAVGGAIDGTINLTGVSVAGGTYGTSPGFAVLGGKPIVVNGTQTDDLITGTLANEAFVGLAGNDTINAGGGNDFVDGGAGVDTIDAGAGIDLIAQTAGQGGGTIQGGTEADTVLLLGTANSDTVTVLYNGSAIASVNGTTLSGVEVVNGTFDAAAPGGSDTLDYTGSSAGVTVDLGGTASGFAANVSLGLTSAISGFENVTGTGLADSLTGDAGANTLTGAGGDDTLRGKGGNDALHGDAGTADTAVYDDASSNYTITYNVTSGNATVAETAVSKGAIDEATDTLDGVELLDFASGDIDLNAQVLVFSSFDPNTGTGTLKSSHSSIQSAVNAADGNDTVYIRNGDYTEQVNVGAGKDGLTILGQSEAGVVIHAPTTGLTFFATDPNASPVNRQLFSVVTVSGSDLVTIKNLTVDGDSQAGQVAGAGDFNGIAYVNSSGTVEDVTVIEIRDTLTSPTQVSGNQRGNAVLATYTSGLPKQFNLINSTITDYQKTGVVMRNATVNLDDNTVTGFGVQATQAQNGIQLSSGSTGLVNNNHISALGLSSAAAAPAGILLFNAGLVTVTGNDYTGTAVTDVAISLSGTSGATISGNIINTAARGVVEVGTMTVENNVVNTGGTANSYANIATWNHEINSTSNIAFTPDGSNGPDRYVTGGGADVLTGNGGDDFLQARGGVDQMLGGAGNDTIVWSAGDGNDTMIDGGTQTTADTLQVLDTAGTDTIQVVTSGATLVGIGGGTANVQDIESVTLNVTAGGTDTIDYTGTITAVSANLATNVLTGFNTVVAGSTIENVTGGSAGDTLIGSSAANVINGAAGDDQITGAGGTDTLSGGADSDTFNYAVGDGQDTVNGGSTGSDVDTLNIAGTAATETYNINPITGYLGINIESGITDVDATDANYEIRTVEVEEIVITTNGGGDSVLVAGDLAGTGVASSTVRVTGDSGNNNFDASGMTGTPVRVVFDGAGGTDTLKGGAAGDLLIGGDGDDTITGNGGNDTIYGGNDTTDTGTADRAVFSGNSTDAIITFTTGQAAGGDGVDVSVSSASGNDTTHGIELLQFDNGTIDLAANVLVFSSYDANTGTGTLKSSHGTIQSAVTAADADDVVFVRNGTYIEQVTISGAKSGLTILGQSEAGVIVQAPNVLVSNGVAPSNGRNVNGIITVNSVSDVSIRNLTVNGALKGGAVVGATNPTLVGIAYLGSDDGLIDQVTVTHVREADPGFGNQRNLGIYVSNADPAAPSTPGAGDLAGLNSIEIKNTTVTDFQKGGIVVSFADANIHHNTVTGRGVTGLTAQNGIQVAGSTGTVNNNTVAGVGYDNPAVSIGYAILTFNNRDLVIDTNHVTGTGVATSSGGIAAIGSTGVKVTNNDLHAVIDAIDVYATASFVDPLAPTAVSNPGGVFDFSSNAVNANVPSGVFFRPFAASTDTFNVAGTNRDDAIYGASVGDSLTAGAGNDYLEGRGGADTVRGGDGNDTIVWNGGDGNDSIEGGTDVGGDDTLQITSNGNLTINGDGTANPSEFTVSVGADTATVKEIEEAAVTLSSGNTLTVTGDFDGTGLNLSTITVTGAGGDETVNASAMTGAGAGSPVGIEFTGNGGNDTFFSGVGADTFHGGTGLDTADYDADYTGANVAWDGTTATVTGARGTDTYDSVGKIVFNNKTVWLVSKDTGSDYTEIAQLFDGSPANGEAAAGDVVLVAAGSYSGNFSVGVNGVTIKGAEAGVEIVGTFKSANGISGSVGEYLKTATGYITTGDRGLTIAADNVTIDNIKIDGAYVGIELGNGAEHTTIRDVTIEDSVNGIRKGTGAQVTDLDIIRGEIRDTYIGMYLSKETADGLDISDVLIDGTKFTNLTEKGIYAESLALATLTGIVMNNVGQFGRGASFGTVGQFGNGIDLNLKWDFETNTGTTDENAPYSGITIENFTFTNVGLSNGGGSPHAGGAAIAVKARDTGSYASPEKASFSGAVVIQNGTINGTSVAIRAGEPGQNIADPDVTVTGVIISNEGFDVDNVTQSPMTVNMINGGDTLTAAATTTGTLIVNGGTGVDNVTAGGGNDTIKGNAGGDALNGGAGTDTAAYTQDITKALITQSGGGWQVATGGTEATDTLTNIEVVDGGEAGKFLLVGNGGYATIQAAITAASAGDTIIVASGTYNENLTIDKALTILGANHGNAGTGPRGAESILNWTTGNAVTVTTTAAVIFDGLKFTGTHVTVASTPDTNITFTDSVFDLISGGNNSNNFYLNQPTSFTFTDNKLDATGYTGALFQPVGTTGNAAHSAVTFTGNTFTGHAGPYVSGDDNNVPVILNLSDVHGTVTGNTFSGVNIGVLVANGAGPLDIGDNTFEHMHRTGPNTGGGLAAGVVFFTPAPFTGTGINIHDNHFNDMDAGIRTSGVPGSTVVGSTITIDDNDFTAVTNVGFQPVGGVLHFTDTSLLPGPTLVPSEFFGGSDNDVITTTAVADIMHGGAGNDTAVYIGTITAANITVALDTNPNAAGNQTGWQVNATAGGEGIDLLDDMEIVNGLGTDKILLVGNGGYATIQAAIDASANGDTIIVAAGLYDEDLTIDKAVTILGAKQGVGGTGGGRDAAGGAGETTIVGHAHVTALGDVTINGMRFLNDATTTNGGPGNPLLQLASGYNHVVTNSIFYSAVGGGVRPAPDDRAISTPVLATGDITISNNYFTGASTGLFGGSPPASWGRAVWFDGGGVDLHVTGNTIEYSRTGLNLDILGTSDVTVHDNTFRSDGTAIAVGFSENNLVATDNDFQNVGDEFNFRNITESVTFDAEIAVDTVTPAVPANPGNDAVFILGGSGNDNLSGTGGVDVIDGNNINAVADTDTLTGRGGNDLLLGRAGADSLDGGAGDDVLDGGADNDTATYTGTITAANITTIVDADPNTGGDQAGWQVNATASSEGTDKLNDVEFVDGLGTGKILLVGNGGFATIQEAVNASGANDTILIAGGTYTEQVTVTGHTHDNLTIMAVAGATVIVKAPAVLTQTATSSSGRAINGVITVSDATNVQISGIDVDGNGNGNAVVGTNANFIGVAYRNASGGLTNVDVTAIRDAYPGGTTTDGFPTQSGNQRGVGVQADNDTNLAFAMTGGSISDFQKNATVFNHTILNVSGVNITGGGAQTINAQNGIQVLNSTGTITGNVINSIGYAGPSNVYSALILAFDNTNLDITANGLTGANVATTAAKVVGVYVVGGSGGSVIGNGILFTDIGVGIYDNITPNGIAVSDNNIVGLDFTDPLAAGVDFEPTAALAVNYAVDGSNAPDILFGGAGADTLNGFSNPDLIEGRGGADALNGGGGDDVFIIASGADHPVGETIDGGGNTDVIRFTSTALGDVLTLRAGVTNIAEIEISDSAGLNTGTVALNIDGSAAGGSYTLTGNEGDNNLKGGSGANTINGGDGADTIDAGAGSDTVNAGAGNDTVIGTADGPFVDTYRGDAGTDTIDYSALVAGQNISIDLGSGGASGAAIGTDTLVSFENATAGGGNDSVFGSSANNVLRGGDGTDNIVGGNGNDQLFGGAGADTLNGGVNDFGASPAAANDVLWGGADTDTFRFESRFGDDSIGTAGNVDWEDGEDMVFVGYASVSPIIADVTDGVLITVNDGSVSSTVFVAGATASQMQVTTSISGLDLLIH